MPDVMVALIRGINVGRAKRVAMADLRRVVAGLGYGGVRTVLNSGNVVFTAAGTQPGPAAAAVEAAVAASLGIAARVTVLTAGELFAAVADNPLAGLASNPSRLLLAVPARADDLGKLRAVTETAWAPEAVVLGPRVAYLWCPKGVIASPLAAAVARALGDAVTTRTWTTMTKLAAAAGRLP